jgi:LysM repeat protein
MSNSKMDHKEVWIRFVTCCLGLIALLLISGCGSEDFKSAYNEEDEPAFQRSRQLLRQGRKEEALKDLLRLIQHRTEAPESHLEVANLYLKEFNDPLLAYYHYRCYLQLRPQSSHAELVRGQLDVAKREFIRTMPGNLMGKELDKVELMEQVRYLSKENDNLKRQLQAMGVRVEPERQSTPSAPRNVTPTPASVPATVPAAAVTQQPPSRPATAPVPPAATTRERTYEVAQGDTLSSISRRMYGHPGGWEKIFQANRDQLPTSNSLKPGQVLRIPAE